ncbi:phosphate/phosphite/phosphonate ABC transporter substrate-binding protein [Fischerella sp. PCC 9605]|uniref:phosphate/phosphite/phosphonate ABC transporter substrate-binding protein n=1 Tax=Fischerella sp. PCC 9605 TaxID=1173024 RepID=UPI000479D662|nr:phosphate/phosphite/phosphonate ABC transporter substrate-binding protein [Fischerella sp. PCC 9605]
MKVGMKGVLSAGVALVAFTSLAVNLVGCTQPENAKVDTEQQAQNSPEQTEAQQVQQTTTPTTLKIAFPTRKDSTDLETKVDAVNKFLSKELGMPVEAKIGDDAAAVEALRANQVDVAFLSSKPALKAEELANARLYLAEVRPNYSGKQTYRSIIVVRKDSPLQSKSSAKETLEQLRGKKMAFTSPTSTSGFVFPVSVLVKEGFVPDSDRLDQFFAQVTYGGDYSKALQAVLRGQADAAAVSEYALFPPYVSETEKNQLRVLHGIPGVPAHGVAIDDDVPQQMRDKIVTAMLKLNQPENNQILRDLYNSTELVEVDHNAHLQPLRDALKVAEKKS